MIDIVWFVIVLILSCVVHLYIGVPEENGKGQI